MPAVAALRPTEPIALWDFEDLAEADLEADLSQRLEDAGWVLLRSDGAGASADEMGQIVAAPGARPGRADAVALAWAIRRGGPQALDAHDLGLTAAVLAD
ncbi:hypothetical protein GCU56_13310 [Geodermatophilus sabuli]|uniref:Uncharacterized protein n=1 Tax=Geodermatophilus sabuli TaxID=1564158 RepID=A0A7K3W1U0_9ACTN|nr:hypothetical protein [Geodermatophilus sabuli]NEK58846.1 hypothetical protein [Geodermatophilus sabuli]